MADWRERGYVPDSDDEEDDVSLKASLKNGQEAEDSNNGVFGTASSHASIALSSESATKNASKLLASSLIMGDVSLPVAHQKANATQSTQEPAPNEEENDGLGPPSPVAQQLGQELQRGLDVCRGILQPSSAPQSDGSDSPLSSLPSSPTESFLHSPRSPTLQVSPVTALLPRPASPSSHPARDSINEHELSLAAGELQRRQTVRSLRQRAPLQLHPYSLEAATYQREWQQRGLRPVRTVFAAGPQQRVVGNREEQSQGTVSYSSSQASCEPLSVPAQLRTVGENDQSQSPPRTHSRRNADGKGEDDDDEDVGTDDELPDIGDIFRSNASARRGSRRKRSDHAHGAQDSRGAVDTSAKPDTGLQRGASNGQSVSIFDLPPSPPRSRSISSSTDMLIDTDFAKPPPKLLPTPVRSSEMRSSKRRIVDVSSPSEDEQSDIGTKDASYTEIPAFMQMRRRIKGVLPASWIKLDARQQKQPLGRQASLRSPQKRPTKGLARHVSPRLALPSDPPQLQFDYNSESDDGSEYRDGLPQDRQRQSHLPGLFDRDVEDVSLDAAIEEDTVDRMPPTGSKRTALKPRKKRQQRLGDSWNAPEKTLEWKATNTTASSSSRQKFGVLSRPRVEKRKGSGPLQLSILDAPGLIALNHARQPRDLRVAARSSKPSREPRIQNPSTKFFQLDTAEDTADLNSGLHEWKAGRIVDLRYESRNNAITHGAPRDPRKIVSFPVQSPGQHYRTKRRHMGMVDSVLKGLPKSVLLPEQSSRHPRSKAYLPQRSNHADTVRFLKASTDTTLARVQIESSSNDPTTSTPANRTKHPILIPGFVSWHQNRAGSGSFLNYEIRSRPTQLEAPAISQRPRKRVPHSTSAGQHPCDTAETRPAIPLTRSSPVIVPSRPKKSALPQRRNHPPAHTNTDQENAVMAASQLAGMSNAKSAVRASGGVLDPTLARQLGSTPSTIAPFPSNGTKMQLSKYISSGQLADAMLFTPQSDLPLRSSQSTLDVIESLESERMIPLTKTREQNGPSVESLMYQAIDVATKDRATADWDYVRSCVESMNDYLTLIFSENRTTEIQTLLPRLLEFVDVQFSKPQDFLAHLGLVVGLLILCYHLCAADGRYILPRHLPASWSVYVRGISILLQCLLKPSSIEILHDFATSQSIASTQNIWPVVEAWIVFFTSLSSPTLRNHSIDLNNMLLQHYNTANPRSDGRHLSTALLFIPGVELVSRIDAGGFFQTVPNVHIDSWSILGPALKDFFEHSIEQSTGDDQISAMVCMLGMNAVRLCLWLAENCAWTVPDALLQMMFKRYGKNEMIELFVPPSVTTAASRISNPQSPITDASNLTDFDIFLRLVTLTLEQKSAECVDTINSVSKRNKLLGLVFSLTPNNSRTMDEHEAIEEAVYVTMANTYALYTVLYSDAPPDCRPRLSQRQNLVSFPTSHARIRDLTITAWSRMCTTALRKGATSEDHNILGGQGKAMWSALSEKLTQAMRFDIRPETTFHHELVVANCKPVLVQLTDIIKQWTCLVGLSSDTREIELYIGIAELLDAVQLTETLREYLQRLSTSSLNAYESLLMLYRSQGTDLAILGLLRAVYFRKQPTLRDQAHRSARELVSGILSSSNEEDSRLQTVVDIWFSLAKLDVGEDLNKWDQYLQPPSPSAFRMIADTQISQQCALLFLGRIVVDVPEFFELDPELIYQFWIIAILQADADLRFEHILTETIIAHNPSALDLMPLNALIKDETGTEQRLTLSLFRHIRTQIVKEIIRAIFNLQYAGPDDSQDLIEEPVDEGSGRRLLRIISDTMRKVWLRLSFEQRSAGYTSFVQAIVQEMEIYTYPGFKLDVWYTDPQRSEFPVARDGFKKLFQQMHGSHGHLIDGGFIATFRQQNQRAANTTDQAPWVRSMVAALSCNNVIEESNADGSLVVDGALQIQFMQNVLSVYVQSAFSEGPRLAVWTIPVVHVLVEVLGKLHFRQDLEDIGRAEAFSNMCLQLLISSQHALQVLGRHDMPRERHILMFATKLIDLATGCIERMRQFRRLNPEIDGLYDLLEPTSQSAQAIFSCITDAAFVTESDRTSGQEAANDSVAVVGNIAQVALSAPLFPVAGTDFSLRQLTLNDIKDGLTRARQPNALSEAWSFWYDGTCNSYIGWEESLDGSEVAAVARSVKDFCTAAAQGAEVIVDGEWQQWENLARFGSRSAPYACPEEVEEEHVVDEWNE